jgi:hypothetical protein
MGHEDNCARAFGLIQASWAARGRTRTTGWFSQLVSRRSFQKFRCFLLWWQDKRRSSEPRTRADCPFPPSLPIPLNETLRCGKPTICFSRRHRRRRWMAVSRFKMDTEFQLLSYNYFTFLWYIYIYIYIFWGVYTGIQQAPAAYVLGALQARLASERNRKRCACGGVGTPRCTWRFPGAPT